MNINPQFVDVDFPSDPNYTFGDCGVATFKPGQFAAYADEAPVYPEDKWPEIAKAIQDAGGGCSQLVTRIYNQKQEGSCVANATSQSNEIEQAYQFGKDRVVHLSAMSLYKRIGSSPNSGASVNDGLDEMKESGILPLTNPENTARFKHTMENTGWSQKLPDGWKDTAKMFKVQEWLVCDHVNEVISRLLSGHPVVVGRQGHSICYCDVVYKDGKLFVKYVNSWGDWGEDGYGFDSLGTIKAASNWAFAPTSVVYPEFQKKVA